jgi:hypothetical protein
VPHARTMILSKVRPTTRILDCMIIARAHELYFPNDNHTTPTLDEEDGVDYGGGTKYTIHVSVNGLPPMVEWTTTTGAEFLELPLGLSAFIMH